MTEEKQGAAEWLRKWARIFGSADAYSCKKFMANEFGVSCSRMRCTDCNAVIFERIADRIESERRLSEGVEWPRFEDGELVKIGDEVEFEGEAAKVRDVAFNAEMFSLGVATATTSGRVYGAFGEPVKRPTPKVLGADGVEIKVGDTVYYDGDPEPLTVGSFDDPGCVYLTSAKGSDGTLYTIEPSLLTHKRPDSWERLEEDAYHLVMSEYLETPEDDVRDIVRRAKALAKAGER